MSSNHVSLRNLTDSDASSIALIADNRKIWLNLRDRFPHPYSLDDAKWYVNYAQSTKDEIIKAIIYESELSGVIGVIPKDDVYSHVGEIGYWLGEKYWRKGVATQAVRLMIEFCQEELALSRIEAGIFGNNYGSMRVLEKCGFQKEAIKKSRINKNGQILDEHFYGLVFG